MGEQSLACRILALTLLVSIATNAQTSPPVPDYRPVVEVQHEDMGEARSHFKTKILRKGPPPTEWEDLAAPAGATQIEFPSGPLLLKAWINSPPANDKVKHPAVLFLHSAFDLGTDHWKVAQPFRDAGYIVMVPTVRGENGQHGIFTMYYDEVNDVINAAEYLRAQPYIDADHLYVAGHSVGGTLAMLAAEIYKHFRAVASISGSTDQAAYVKYARLARENAPFDLTDPKEIQLRSPLAYAASFKCPIRIYYGTQEEYYAFAAPRTAEIAKEHGVDAQAIAVNGDHNDNLPESIKLAIDFFRQQH
jgi:dienelactone hydrolase